jgi:hypothetical protein
MRKELIIAVYGDTPEGWDDLLDFCEWFLREMGKMMGGGAWDRNSRLHGVSDEYGDATFHLRYDKTIAAHRVRTIREAQFDTFERYLNNYGLEAQNLSL